MLHRAYLDGAQEAYARFGLKEAGLQPGALARFGRSAWDSVKAIPRMMVGHPDKVWEQGRAAFKPKGILNPADIFWPSVARGAEGQRLPQVMGWMGRANTAMSGYNIYKSMKGEAGDPNEGRLSNTLSAAGGALGMGFGFPAAGMLGAPLLGHAGASLGKGVGRILGSAPVPQQPDPSMYDQGVYQ